MRNFKKVLALVLATMMVSAMAMSAIVYADPAGTTGGSGSGSDTVTITVKRDSTYEGEEGADSRIFTWYRVFTVVTDPENHTTGAQPGYDGSGNPIQLTDGGSGVKAAYTATSAVAAKLGNWVPAETDASGTVTNPAHWEKVTGNLWFDLAPIAGTTNYSVKWADGVATDALTAQAAAKWLLENEVYEESGTLDFSNQEWSAEVVKGYYILESEAGKNLIAATTDIEVYEKNDYPSLDKTQNDNDDETSGTYGDENVNVAVGDIINYKVEVTVPKTATAGEKILVWDKATEGLEYVEGSVVASPTASVAAVEKTDKLFETGWAWAQMITVTEENKGDTYTFTFSMKVTKDAIVIDSEKKNESGLKYGTGSGSKPFPYESKPDEVEYQTYFGGIHKIDGTTEDDLPGVEFMLKENGVEFPVSFDSGSGYYYYDASGSSTVVTDASGTIKIRGLDGSEDKTYTLTETKALDGYNMLEEDVTLTVYLDSITKYTYTQVAAGTAFSSGTTYYTKDGNTYTEAKALVEFASGTTYYTRSGSTTSGTFGAFTSWQVVENNSGSLLPSTGGIGTTIFYIVGGLLAVGAGVVLVSKKRMGKVDD